MRVLLAALMATLFTSTISGTVIAVKGDAVQFREDNGSTVTVRSHIPLRVGAHYSLRGHWDERSINAFVANSATRGGYGNAYPQPGSTASVQGVIMAIHNNRVTIAQGSTSSITIDDQQAMNNGTAQNLFVGRSITAYGYWNGGRFYATSIA